LISGRRAQGAGLDAPEKAFGGAQPKVPRVKRDRATTDPRQRADLLCPLALAALVAVFLSPYLILGRSMVPLDLIPIFQPWARHARELWPSVPEVWNPLLDSIQQYYPRRVYMAEALAGGWLPFWNPNVYGGTPFLATQQASVLYPPAWLLALLPAAAQFGWSAFLHLSLAAVGSYWFLREMGVRPAAAMTGGVAFALNGFVVVWLAYPNVTQWTLCWLPLALFLWERGRERDDLHWIAGSGAALAVSFLGGHGQSSEYLLLAWGAWAAMRSWSGGVSGLLRWTALPALLAIGLALGHLLPCLEYLPRTDRGGRIGWPAVQRAAMPPAQLWTFVLPRLFGDDTLRFGTPGQSFWMPQAPRAEYRFIERSFYPGIAVLGLAFAAAPLFGAGPRARRLLVFSVALALVGLLLALGTPLYWPLWRFVPGFGQFTAAARVVCVAGWGLACLAALGVHALTEPDATTRRRAAQWAIGGAAGLAALAISGHAIYGGLAPDPIRSALQTSGRPGVEASAIEDLAVALGCLVGVAVLALLLRSGPNRGSPLRPGLAAGGLVLLVAADLSHFGFGYNPRSDPSLLRAEPEELQALRRTRGEPARFLSLGPPGQEMAPNRRMPSNLASTYGLADIAGSDSFVPLRYRAWEAASSRASGGSPWSRPGSANLRALGVRWYLSGSKELYPGLRPVPHMGAALQEDAGALPYARLHTNVQALRSESVVAELLAEPHRVPVVALTSGPGAPSFDGRAAVTPFRIRRTNGNRLVCEGTAPAPGLLVVCEQLDPGWTARVDGAPAPVVAADLLQIGVPLAAGEHRVELTYAPPGFRLGGFVSGLALAAICGLFGASRRRFR
jgi:hypothetical protein